jgi:hypothetical protein
MNAILSQFKALCMGARVITVNDGEPTSHWWFSSTTRAGNYWMTYYDHPDLRHGRLLLLENEIEKGHFDSEGTFHVGLWQVRFFILKQCTLGLG